MELITNVKHEETYLDDTHYLVTVIFNIPNLKNEDLYKFNEKLQELVQKGVFITAYVIRGKKIQVTINFSAHIELLVDIIEEKLDRVRDILRQFF